LESICLYASQKIGTQKKTEQAAKPRATSSTQASSKLYQLGALEPRVEGLTACHIVPEFQFFQVFMGLALIPLPRALKSSLKAGPITLPLGGRRM
jgi:hypothetical protein